MGVEWVGPAGLMLVGMRPGELLWVGESRREPGLIELVCFNGAKRHRGKDGSCRAQWAVLGLYMDPDNVGRTLLVHYGGRGDPQEEGSV